MVCICPSLSGVGLTGCKIQTIAGILRTKTHDHQSSRELNKTVISRSFQEEIVGKLVGVADGFVDRRRSIYVINAFTMLCHRRSAEGSRDTLTGRSKTPVRRSLICWCLYWFCIHTYPLRHFFREFCVKSTLRFRT